MGKMRFGTESENVEVQKVETIPQEKIIPENRPSPIEKMIATKGDETIVKLYQSLEKFKQNSIARMDKYKRRISEIPVQLESTEKKVQEYVDVKIEEMEGRVETIETDIVELSNENKKLLENIDDLRDEFVHLKADYNEHLEKSHKNHRIMYALMAILMLASVAGIIL